MEEGGDLFWADLTLTSISSAWEMSENENERAGRYHNQIYNTDRYCQICALNFPRSSAPPPRTHPSESRISLLDILLAEPY